LSPRLTHGREVRRPTLSIHCRSSSCLSHRPPRDDVPEWSGSAVAWQVSLEVKAFGSDGNAGNVPRVCEKSELWIELASTNAELAPVVIGMLAASAVVKCSRGRFTHSLPFRTPQEPEGHGNLANPGDYERGAWSPISTIPRTSARIHPGLRWRLLCRGAPSDTPLFDRRRSDRDRCDRCGDTRRFGSPVVWIPADPGEVGRSGAGPARGSALLDSVDCREVETEARET
jgi:hypothetical protein